MTDQILKQVKLLSKTYNIKADKNKGQNFLVNYDIIKTIADSANLSQKDTVLEVGPGFGILTEELVKRAGNVISVELDKKLFDFIKTKFIDNKNFKVVNKDILFFENEEEGLTELNYKIVANIPYNITSTLFKKFITKEPRPKEMVVLIQKEVAERICAKQGSLSLLAISIQLYGEPKIVEVVDRENFYPSPDVDSAILKIENFKSQKEIDKLLQGISEDIFWRLLRISFASKRKQLHNNLSSGLKISSEEAKKLLKKANFDPALRAQNLSIKDWILLAQVCKDYLQK